MIKRHINIIKLICYFLIMPILVWNLTIGKSLSLWRECEKNKKELSGMNIYREEEEQNELEVSVNGYLLDSIARDKNIEIVKYSRFITYSIDDYSLVANVLVVSGDYFRLMEAVNQLENTWTINSLSFRTEMNYKNKQKSLNATIITQDVLKMN